MSRAVASRAGFARAGWSVAAVALLGLAVLVAAATPLSAQETVIEAQVEQIAGSDIYINTGTDRGVGPGSER